MTTVTAKLEDGGSPGVAAARGVGVDPEVQKPHQRVGDGEQQRAAPERVGYRQPDDEDQHHAHQQARPQHP